MARRACNRKPRAALPACLRRAEAFLLLLLLLAGGTAFAQASEPPSLAGARDALQRGDNQAALTILRAFRAANPGSPRTDESLAMSVQAALATGDQYLARYFAQKLVADSPGSPATFQSCLRVAARAYASRSYSAALEFYADAVASFDAGAKGARRDLDMALLRAAELSLYHERDARSAGSYFHRIDPGNVPPEEVHLLRAMRVRLAWNVLSPEKLGLADANVSTLKVDDDDLWVGTWNGGLARYSVSAGASDAFPVPAYPRSVEIAGRRVWVGSTDGLGWYGKATGTWGTEDAFASPAPRKVQSLKLVGDALYAGTLGDGLFRLDAALGWGQVSDGELPGMFVTCIEESRNGASLYLGTMSFGLVVVDLRTGSMQTLSEIVPSFSAPNVTSVLEDTEGRVWVGTYGDGLYLWQPKAAQIRHFSRSTGELGDDWILAICQTARAVYFGTFGGGVSAFLAGSASSARAKEAWRRIGISDGLGSLDVSAIAWRAPYVFFGTLGAGVSVYDEEADGP